MRKKRADQLIGMLIIFILSITGLITLFPLYYIFVISFTDPVEYLKGGLILFPSQWSLVSYEYLLSTPAFIRSIGVSSFLAIVGTLCGLIVTSALAYTLSRKRLI